MPCGVGQMSWHVSHVVVGLREGEEVAGGDWLAESPVEDPCNGPTRDGLPRPGVDRASGATDGRPRDAVGCVSRFSFAGALGGTSVLLSALRTRSHPGARE